MNPLLAIGLLIVVAGVFADAFSGGKTVKFAAKPKTPKEEKAPPKTPKEENPGAKDD